jgi:hypothetical protein
MQIHLHRNQSPEPSRKGDYYYYSRYKKDIFFFEQKLRNYEISDDIIIGCYKNQITKFNCHGFGKCNRISSENEHPKKVNASPKQHMIYGLIYFQKLYFIKGNKAKLFF